MRYVPAISVRNAKVAIQVYQDVFKAKLIDNVILMNDMPGYENRYVGLVAHAKLQFGDQLIYVNDILEDEPQKIGDNVQFCLYVDSLLELESARESIPADFNVFRQIEEEYWGAKSFSVKDPFEVVWHIYYVYEND